MPVLVPISTGNEQPEAPVFEYVPIIQDAAKAKLKVVSITGLSTKHFSSVSDRGRLYFTITKPGGVLTVKVYRDVRRLSLVMQGSASGVSTYFDLAEVSGSGLTARAWIDSYSVDLLTGIMIPTFALDEDVQTQVSRAAAMPGYSDTWGLASFHAQAMRQIMASDLPAAVPYLFGGSGLSAFVPQGHNSELPDITKLANVDQLRVAQGSLVKALSNQEAEHLEEPAAIAELARERYDLAMKKLAEANVKDEVAAEDVQSDYSVSTWSRG